MTDVTVEPETGEEVVRPESDPTVCDAPAADLAVISPEDIPLVPGYEEGRDLARLAVTLAAADIVPAALRGKPNNVFLVLLTGRDLGIKPTVAIRTLHVIEGQVTLPPKLRLAIVHERGLGRIWSDPANDDRQATWHAVRADNPTMTRSLTFGWDDAQRIVDRVNKQTGEPISMLTDKSNWKNYPQRMLSWRCLGYLLDDVFPEVGTGLYSPDDLGAVTDDEGEPVDVIDVDPFPGMKGGARREPDDPPLADETVRAIFDRIGALPVGPPVVEVDGVTETAVDALRTKWKESELPAPQQLRARQYQRATALLDWIERRAKAGEWGPWPPEPATPTEGPDIGSTPPTAVGTSETAGDGPSGPPAGGEPGGGDGGFGEVAAGSADPAMCLHPPEAIDEVDGRSFCAACGEVVR